jgi:hypothetical protein
MAKATYNKQLTPHVVIDSFNDFPSEARYVIARTLPHERTVVFLICCRF